MSFKKQIFAQAIREIEQRAQDAKLTAAAHDAEIREKLPTVFEMRRELARTGAEIGKAIFTAHGNPAESIQNLKQHNLYVQQRIADELEENGYPANYLSINFSCPDCRDTGFVGSQKCKCLKAVESRLMAERLRACSALDRCSFDNFSLDYYPKTASDGRPSPRETMRKIYNYCRNYADTFTLNADSILLFGGTGLGKTHLSLAIAGKAIEKGYGVLYGSVQEFLRMIEDEHFGRTRTLDENTLDELIEAELLILDDLGVEFYSEFNISTIHHILSTRLNLHRPTIISTNLSAPEIEQRYSARIVSRIFSSYVCLRCEGADVRLIKAQNARKK